MGLLLDLKDIGNVCNIKLSALNPLSIAGVEGLSTISFLVKSTYPASKIKS